MLIRIDAKKGSDFSGEIGEFNFITGKLKLWYSPMYMANSEETITVKDFDIPDNCKSIELVDEHAYETLAVPISVFKEAYIEGKGYTFNYADWKKKYLKVF